MLIDHNADRRLSLGGSDIPKIMGTSKFGNAWDLLQEKLFGEKKEVCNAYVEVGNIFEPKIQEVMNIENVDEIEYTKDVEKGLPFKAHIDGIVDREKKHMAEIKVSAYDIKEIKKQYEWQIRFYMHVAGFDKCTLYLYQREKGGDVKEKIDNIHKSYGIKPYNALTLAEYACKDLVLRDVHEAFDDYEVTKKDVQKSVISYNENKEKKMLEQIELFNSFVDEWQSNVFGIDINDFEYRFKKAFKIKQKPVTAKENKELVDKVEDFLSKQADIKLTIDKLNEQLEQGRKDIAEFAKVNDRSLEVETEQGIVTVKHTAAKTTFKPDNKKIQAEWLAEHKFEEVPKEYTKESNSKESITLSVKKKENNE